MHKIVHPSLDINSLCLLAGAECEEDLFGVRMLLKPYWMWLLDVNDKSEREIDSVFCGQVKSFPGHWLLCQKKPKSSRKGIAWWMWRHWLYLQVVLEILGSSSNDEGDGNENGKKNKRFRLAKQQPCTSITLFCAFPCRRCATTTWNCLISRVFGGREQRPSFAFSELWYSPLESTSRKIRQHLTSWTRWNKRDEVWTRANTLFNWRFRSRRRHRCWSSLL